MTKEEKFEENPFEEEQIAQEWINSVEKEQGLIRDNEIYPLLKKWSDNIRGTIIDIGSGQGICSEKISLKDNSFYIGVEPSTYLIKRAQKLYNKPNRKFVRGNAYKIPTDDEFADACFSVNVWFHLENLNMAAQEMARILKRGGKFLIITANPTTYNMWQSSYLDSKVDGKKIVGKAKVPINLLSRNIFYKHSEIEILKALTNAKLTVVEKIELGKILNTEGLIFVAISGVKTR